MKKSKAFILPFAAFMMLTFTSSVIASGPVKEGTDPIRGPKCNEQGYCQDRP